jgi:hypothetical protein
MKPNGFDLLLPNGFLPNGLKSGCCRFCLAPSFSQRMQQFPAAKAPHCRPVQLKEALSHSHHFRAGAVPSQTIVSGRSQSGYFPL